MAEGGEQQKERTKRAFAWPCSSGDDLYARGDDKEKERNKKKDFRGYSAKGEDKKKDNKKKEKEEQRDAASMLVVLVCPVAGWGGVGWEAEGGAGRPARPSAGLYGAWTALSTLLHACWPAVPVLVSISSACLPGLDVACCAVLCAA